MIEYISGRITGLTPAYAVIETAGIGYGLHISLNTYSALKIDTNHRLYVHEAIREDAHVLYGFIDKHEREIFLLLISVSGVGPNTGRMIISSLSPREIENVILSENVNILKGVKGIGAKTAQRIIVDLKDKIKPTSNTLDIGIPQNNAVANEAMAALVMLGFPPAISGKAVQKIMQNAPLSKVEDVIKTALKML